MGAIAAGCQGAGWMRVACRLGIGWCERGAALLIFVDCGGVAMSIDDGRLVGDFALELLERVGLTNGDLEDLGEIQGSEWS
jgi:hypothetical protein